MTLCAFQQRQMRLWMRSVQSRRGHTLSTAHLPSSMSRHRAARSALAIVATVTVLANVVAPLTASARSTGPYWLLYQGHDCPYEDVYPKPACNSTLHTVAQMEAACNALGARCAGFNTHGCLKNASCAQNSMVPQPTVDLYLKSTTPPAPDVWPQPQSFTMGTASMAVSPALAFSVASPSPAPKTLTDAFMRYMPLVFPHRAMPDAVSHTDDDPGPMLKDVVVTVTDGSEAPPDESTDESYTLSIPGPGAGTPSDSLAVAAATVSAALSASSRAAVARAAAGGTVTINAATVYGALRGLETLSQLVRFNATTASYAIASTPIQITDAPRFAFRTLMIDTARHFYPVSVLTAILDAMSYAKLNALHWHIVDDQSFPLVARTPAPPAAQLAVGRFSDAEVYTLGDVAYLVEYARQRGIRVILETDVPGHASAMCTGVPDMCPSPTCLKPLDPSVASTFDTINALRKDIMSVAPDAFAHMGGDEVDTACWSSTPRIAAWLASRNMTADDAYAYFVQRVANDTMARGQTVVNWVEVWERFGKQLDPRTIVHVWKSKAELAGVLADGYRAILSNNAQWYLTGSHVKSVNWTTCYDNEPFSDPPISDPAQQRLLLGGGAALWSESSDASTVHQLLWPRAAAVAERLWSARSVNDTAAAEPRLMSFRCLLNQRGIPAGPVEASVADTPPPGPGSCFQQ